MRALCIGGPHDGEHHDVPDNFRQGSAWTIAGRTAISGDDFNIRSSNMPLTHYTVYELHTPTRVFKLLVHGMTLEEALSTLMRYYGGQSGSDC